MSTNIVYSLCIALAAAFSIGACGAQTPASPSAKPLVMSLWQNNVPLAKGTKPEDNPEIQVFLPEKKSDAAIPAFLIYPGGAYGWLSMDNEGVHIAKWLNDIGLAGIIVKYRIAPPYHYPVELLDAQRAIRTVRANSAKWGIDPQHVGVIGFSAGGHLASLVSTFFDDGNPDAADTVDRFGCRPDAAILVYPVISMTDPLAHTGSRDNLIGPNADPKLYDQLSTDKEIKSNTPPTFIVAANDDTTVHPGNSVAYYLALKKANISAELHIFDFGGHGFGIGSGANAPWPDLAKAWLGRHGMLPK
jgi:acetyl esterase/lipase